MWHESTLTVLSWVGQPCNDGFPIDRLKLKRHNGEKYQPWSAQNTLLALKAFRLTNNMLQNQDHNQNYITATLEGLWMNQRWLALHLTQIQLKLYSVARFDGLPLTVTYWHQFSSTTLSFSYCMFPFSQPNKSSSSSQRLHIYIVVWLVVFLLLKFSRHRFTFRT